MPGDGNVDVPDCPVGTVTGYADECFLLLKEEQQYDSGPCTKYGASLASIHSQQTNEMLAKVTAINGVANYMLGGSSDEFMAFILMPAFKWDDGSIWDYEGWEEDGKCNSMLQ